MKSIINYELPTEPIDALAIESKFDAFICKNYPSTCNECLYGWHYRCKIDDTYKEDSINTKTRPAGCPLIKPTYMIDSHGYRYPCLQEVEWVSRDPVITMGSVIISLDLKKVKIGDGKSNYTSLPFIHDNIKGDRLNMNIVTKQKETYVNHTMCDCGGEFKYNKDNACGDIFGAFFSSGPCQYQHKCNKCGKEESFPKVYPDIVEIERLIDQTSATVKFVQKTGKKE